MFSLLHICGKDLKLRYSIRSYEIVYGPQKSSFFPLPLFGSSRAWHCKGSFLSLCLERSNEKFMNPWMLVTMPQKFSRLDFLQTEAIVVSISSTNLSTVLLRIVGFGRKLNTKDEMRTYLLLLLLVVLVAY